MNYNEILAKLLAFSSQKNAGMVLGFFVAFTALEDLMRRKNSLYAGIEFPDSVTLDTIRSNLFDFEPGDVAMCLKALRRANLIEIYDDGTVNIFVKSKKPI